MCRGTRSTATCGFICIYVRGTACVAGHRRTGGHPGGRRAGGHSGGRRTGGHSGGRYATDGQVGIPAGAMPPAAPLFCGVEQEKVGHVRLANACLASSGPFANETSRHISPDACFFTSGQFFLTRVGHVRVWKPFITRSGLTYGHRNGDATHACETRFSSVFWSRERRFFERLLTRGRGGGLERLLVTRDPRSPSCGHLHPRVKKAREGRIFFLTSAGQHKRLLCSCPFFGVVFMTFFFSKFFPRGISVPCGRGNFGVRNAKNERPCAGTPKTGRPLL
jgi:hypothetical protein